MSDLIGFLKGSSVYFEQNVCLKDVCTFKIGGTAELICYPSSTEQVSKLVKFCNANKIEYLSLGRGSNVLFSDDSLKKLIIKTDRLNALNVHENQITAGAGVMLAKASRFAVDCGLKGMEFAYGIPGSIGGAVFMNAGAYGGEMSQVVYSTEYVDKFGEVKILKANDHAFGYRKTYFTNKNCIITSVTLLLEPGDIQESERLIGEFQTARKTKQPLEFPSAGSVFKRPEGHFAGKLIQDCNLGGYSVGGAQVSTKHCGFIINTGNATCLDVKNLIKHIQKTVFDTFGVMLECEIKFISE